MKESLCWTCQNAVPDGVGHGCQWSESLQPVPGWRAVKTQTRYDHGKGRKRIIQGYFIKTCPQYLRDGEEKT